MRRTSYRTGSVPLGSSLLQVGAVCVVIAVIAGLMRLWPQVEVAGARMWMLPQLAAALGLVYFQHELWVEQRRVRLATLRERKLHEEQSRMRRQIGGLKEERLALQQQIGALNAQQQLYRAASVHHTFRDAMDEIAGVVHEIAGARELTVFLSQSYALGPHQAGSGTPLPVPHAHYRIGREAELCLVFNNALGSLPLWSLDPNSGYFRLGGLRQCSLCRVEGAVKGKQLVITAALELQAQAVAEARLVTAAPLDGAPPSTSALEERLWRHLEGVSVCERNAREALDRRRLDFHHSGGIFDLACPLSVGAEKIGAIKVTFQPRPDEEFGAAMLERGRLMSASAIHIARAIYSDRLYELATRDALTGLFNKRYLIQQLEGCLHVASRHQTEVSLVLADLDHFKRINDTYGHLTGDRLLRAVACAVQGCLRAADMACRYGGEELAVIVPETSTRGAEELAERLRDAVAKLDFCADDGAPIPVTVSLGVASYEPGIGRIEDLIARADMALYRAKKDGRNRAVSWPSISAECANMVSRVTIAPIESGLVPAMRATRDLSAEARQRWS